MSLLRSCTMRDHLLRPCPQRSAALLEIEKGEDYCKEQEKGKLIPCLNHEDIITEILNRVPAELLYPIFRFVCKSWMRIITSPVFQHNHPLSKDSPPPCLIIQNLNYTSNKLVTTKKNKCLPQEEKCLPQGQADILIHQAKRLRYGTNNMGEEGIMRMDLSSAVRTLRSAGARATCSSIRVGQEGILQQVDLTSDFNNLLILAACNGLTIVHPHTSPPDTLYLVNFLTKESIKLPPPPRAINIPGFGFPAVGFTLVPSTGEYKVVLLREDGHQSLGDSNKWTNDPYFNIQVLTFGGSGGASSYDDLHWRVYQAPQWSIRLIPIAVNGVLYWTGTCNRIVTCFDPIEERFYICPFPGHTELDKKEGLLEIVAGYPAYYLYSPYYQQLEVWILKNFRKGGEWVKYSSTRIGDQGIASCIDKMLYPALSYGSHGEVVIFVNYSEGNLLAYNLRSGIWWNMGNKVKVAGDIISFRGFHVNKILPLDSLLKKKQPATNLTRSV